MKLLKFIRKWLFRMAVAFVLISGLLVLPLRWIDPPASAFMLKDRLTRGQAITHEWVAPDRISPHLALAVIASEDQNFPDHLGFDTRQIQRALGEFRRNGRLRGASTISQQLARNLYLWPERSWVRKGLESWFTVWLELCLPKRRILDIYLNVAEFDDGVYGAEAGARRYFNRAAADLTPAQAALMAAVLPAPKRYNAAAPDAFLQQRQRWIMGQMRNLGDGWVPP